MHNSLAISLAVVPLLVSGNLSNHGAAGPHWLIAEAVERFEVAQGSALTRLSAHITSVWYKLRQRGR